MAEKPRNKIIIGIAVLYIALAALWYLSLSGAKVRVTVKSGDGASAAAWHLKESGLIMSKSLFLSWTKLTGSAGSIKAGTYEFTQRDGTFKILRELKSGSKSLIKFTVPEGSNIRQTAEIIAQIGSINEEKFIKIAAEKKAEGYLMPETYFIDPGMNEEQIVNMMRREFDKKVTPDMYARAAELNMPMEDIITLASIIEKEAVKPEERTVISAVFYNRIKKNIRLESCATVLYAMGVNKARLTVEDTKIDSPYNTYRHKGLPPGPICSPGIESIRAALYPANTGSLFFVSAGNGSHIFSESLEEHVKNKNITKKMIKRQQSKK